MTRGFGRVGPRGTHIRKYFKHELWQLLTIQILQLTLYPILNTLTLTFIPLVPHTQPSIVNLKYTDGPKKDVSAYRPRKHLLSILDRN